MKITICCTQAFYHLKMFRTPNSLVTVFTLFSVYLACVAGVTLRAWPGGRGLRMTPVNPPARPNPQVPPATLYIVMMMFFEVFLLRKMSEFPSGTHNLLIAGETL